MNFLSLTIIFPLFGLIILFLSYQFKLSENISSIFGVGSIGLSFLTTLIVLFDFIEKKKHSIEVYHQKIFNWISIGKLHINIGFYLDSLSLMMIIIITGIGFLILLYAYWYMKDTISYYLFFIYANLFLANILLLVLADNLLLMYLGWEGVSLCSYLLINLYYFKIKNNNSAIKAFITTKVGDILLLISILIFYHEIGTLNFNEISIIFTQKIHYNKQVMISALIFLLGGVISKTAQFPLHTWLADAMVSPSPVSALIHATTMIIAGIYLITRTHVLFILFPYILNIIIIIGIISLILGSFSALVQYDLKKILAYSTISQVGYIFLAMGTNSWQAAIYHLITHAFFKALLFLSSGTCIKLCNYEQNIFNMVGFKKSIPLIYICFLVGGLSLSALPVITSGFYSKEKILLGTLSTNHYGLFLIGLIGTLLTSMYIFRPILIIFNKNEKFSNKIQLNLAHNIPLLILVILSTFIGSYITTPLLRMFSNENLNINNNNFSKIMISMTEIISIYVAINLSKKKFNFLNRKKNKKLFYLLHNSWGFDWLYEKCFIKSYLKISKLLSFDPFGNLINKSYILVKKLSFLLVFKENQTIDFYLVLINLGTVIVTMLLLFNYNH